MYIYKIITLSINWSLDEVLRSYKKDTSGKGKRYLKSAHFPIDKVVNFCLQNTLDCLLVL